jgi:outer membrane protein assembly factor BamB
VLIGVFGMRMELAGNALQPIFYFGDREEHYAAIERDRAERLADLPSPATDVTPPVPPAKPEATPVAAEAPPEPPAPLHNAYWTDYRGPNRDGHYTQTPVLAQWPADGLEELWRHPIGGGYASFVVADGAAFTIEQRRAKEVVAAYDLDTGNELWTNSWDADFQETMGGPGPRTTPTWDAGRIFALGAEGEFRVMDAKTGKTTWRKNILEENGAGNLHWAMSASPLIVEEKVIVMPGGAGGQSVVAYHKETGERIWSSQNDRAAYTSPMLVTLAGRRQLILVTAARVIGLTVEDGTLLWEYPWVTDHDINATQPVITGKDTFMISAGYGHGAALLKIAPVGDGFKAEQVWESKRMKNKFASSVLHDGHIYGLDGAILACIDVATGKLMWKGGRYGYGQLLLADGHLIVTTEKGDVVQVKASPDSHQEVARFTALNGKTWNTPALADGRLLVRNAREMACYRISK